MAILSLRDHPGGPWEQQDGFEVIDNRIRLDSGVVSGLVFVSFWGSKYLKIRFRFSGLFPGHIFIDF